MTSAIARMDTVVGRSGAAQSAAARWGLIYCVVLVYACYVFASEKIEVGGGFGWDGQYYAQWAQQGEPSYSGHQIRRYYISRSLPCLAIHQVLRGLHAEMSSRNTIFAFEMMNILLVLLAAWCWTHIADRLALTERGRWLGAAALFLNCAHKLSAFDPVLLDEWAFGLGMLQLLLFLDRRRWSLALVTLAGAFCWPTILYTGASLIVCIPRRSRRFVRPTWNPSPLATFIALLVAVAWGIYCSTVVDLPILPNIANEPIVRPLVPLSIAATVAAAFWALQPVLAIGLLPAVRHVRDYLGPNLILGLVLLVGVGVVQHNISLPFEGDPDQFLVNAVTSIQKPGLFLLAHIIFFGPIVLVAFFRWRDVVASFSRYGPGLSVVMLGGLFLFLNSESRRMGDVFAFVAPFAIKILDDRRLPARFLLAFAAWTVLFSRYWLRIEGELTTALSDFPAQLYFMNHGPWMSLPMYVLHVAIVVPLGFWIWRTLKTAYAAS